MRQQLVELFDSPMYNNQTTPYLGWKLSKIRDELNEIDILFGDETALYSSLEEFLLNSDTIKFIE